MVVYHTGFLRFFLVVLINCIYFGAYSQVIPLTDKEFSKQNSITLIKTDVYDISGSVTRGYLYHVSDSVIFLSNYSRDTVYAFHANDIHRLSVYRGRGLSAASAVTFGISNLVVLNWAFTSGDFLTHLLIGNTFFAIPLASVPLIINGLVNPDLDFETETLASNHVVLDYLKKNVAAPKFKWDSPIERKDLNQKVVDQFSRPPRHKHPQCTSRFFYQFNLPPRYQLFRTNLKSISEPKSQLERDINNRKVSYHTDFTFGIRVLPKINIAYSNQWHIIKGKNGFYLDNTNQISFGNLVDHLVLLRYTINPVERILKNRHELSLNAYTVFSNYIFEINQIDNEDTSGSLGKVISAYGVGVQYNLFFSRNLSVFGGINTQYLSSRIDFKEPEFAHNSYRFSSMALSLGAGLAIHL